MPARAVRVGKPVSGVVNMLPFTNAGQGSMRIVALILFSIAASSGPVALAQSESAARDGAENSPGQEAPEEVIVRGRRLGELRFEVEVARERAYDIFNEINSNDDFDVRCHDETRYFSHSKRRVCRAQFEDRISADAAAEYMRMLTWTCPASASGAPNLQSCIFSGYGQRAAGSARTVEAQLPNKRDQFEEEILRLANEDERFAQAILDFYEASQQYETARKRRED